MGKIVSASFYAAKSGRLIKKRHDFSLMYFSDSYEKYFLLLEVIRIIKEKG